MSEILKPQIVSPEDVANLLAIDRDQVDLWLAEGKIPHVETSGGEILIHLQGCINALSRVLDLSGDLEKINQAASLRTDGEDPLVRA